MAPASTQLFVFFLFMGFSGLASGRSFLEAGNTTATHEERTKMLIGEIESVLRPGAVSRRIQRLELALAPLFQSLPKNDEGRLERPWAHYALHRLFSGLNGWSVHGLEPGIGGVPAVTEESGEAVNGDVSQHLSADIEALIEDRIGGRGFGLKDVAVLAATLEHLIHDKASTTLKSAYGYLKLPVDGELGERDFLSVLDACAALHLASQITSFPEDKVVNLLESMDEIYPSWKDTQLLIRDSMKMVEYYQKTMQKPFHTGRPPRDFDHALEITELAMQSVGKLQNQADCFPMKDALLEKGDRGTGRIPLSDFYRKRLDSTFLFEEGVQSLRGLGALDESTELPEPHVIVPNYLQAGVNCLHTPGLFSICCEDECASLVGDLERKVSAPSAEPALIAELVSRLPSSTVDAPRNLSETLRHRLEQLAEMHGGQVPLHGRAFAQWMHHAYPRECAMPRAGAAPPKTAQLAAAVADLNGASGTEASLVLDIASLSQMEEYVQSMAPAKNSTTNASTFADLLDKWEHMPVEDHALPWKLDGPGKRRQRARSPIRDAVRGIVMLIALGSALVGLARTAGNAVESVLGDQVQPTPNRPFEKIHCV